MPDAGNNVARIEMHNLTDKTYIFFFFLFWAGQWWPPIWEAAESLGGQGLSGLQGKFQDSQGCRETLTQNKQTNQHLSE